MAVRDRVGVRDGVRVSVRARVRVSVRLIGVHGQAVRAVEAVGRAWGCSGSWSD